MNYHTKTHNVEMDSNGHMTGLGAPHSTSKTSMGQRYTVEDGRLRTNYNRYQVRLEDDINFSDTYGIQGNFNFAMKT